MDVKDVIGEVVDSAEHNLPPDSADLERRIDPIDAFDGAMASTNVGMAMGTSSVVPTLIGLCSHNEKYKNTIPSVLDWLEESYKDDPQRVIKIINDDNSESQDLAVYARAGLRGKAVAVLWALTQHKQAVITPALERASSTTMRMRSFKVNSSIRRASRDIKKELSATQKPIHPPEEDEVALIDTPEEPVILRPFDFAYLEFDSKISKEPPRGGVWRPLRLLGQGGGGIVHLACKSQLFDPYGTLERLHETVGELPGAGWPNDKFAASKRLMTSVSRMLFPPKDALGAIKEPLLDKITDRDSRAKAEERFSREIEALALSDKHPNLIRMLDHDPGKKWFVMEVFDEGTLHEHAVRFHGRVRKTLEVMIGVVGALDLLHKHGLIHRDIKPKNIFVANGCRRLVLADLGVVWRKEEDLTRLTEGSDVPGSRDWMPNWIKHKQKTLDDFSRSCDLYSLGKAIYWCVAGQNVEPSQLRKEDNDLTKLFPRRPEMEPLMEFFNRVIVDDEEKCIQDAATFRKGLLEILNETP